MSTGTTIFSSNRDDLSGWRGILASRPGRLAVAALVLAVAAGTAAAQTTSVSGKIVYGRSVSNTDGSVRNSSLFRVNADRSSPQRLTPAVDAVYHTSPSWSSGGGRIVYSQFDAALNRWDLRIMSSRGTQDHQITSGPENFHTPVWGPGGTIAFTTDFVAGSGLRQHCVGTIRADGTEQHRLFCPPDPASRPTVIRDIVWSADGNHVYVDTNHQNGLEEDGFSVVFKVDVQTREATELTTRHWFVPPTLSFAPDGSHALYSEYVGFGSGRMRVINRVDFASDQATQLTDDGYAGLYSKDGSRIAFTRTIESGDIRYDHLFVMDADGSNVRQLTVAQVDNIEYIPVEWSEDGRYLLVNRAIYVEEADGDRQISRRALRLINADTRAVQALPAGYVYPGAWFQRQ